MAKRIPGTMNYEDKKYCNTLDEAIALCQETDLDRLAASPDYKLAVEVVQAVKESRAKADIRYPDSPWWNWWNQIDRCSMSILGNIAESAGRGGGHTIYAYTIARGEAFEAASLTSVGPPELRAALEPITRKLVEVMNAYLLDLCTKWKEELESKYRLERATEADTASTPIAPFVDRP